eukprot:Colp12_sorted_trinity150504_noHs@22127
MAGGGPDDGAQYSTKVGFIYIFNLIVGAGALNIPNAFSKSGLVAGTVLLFILCFTSYVCATFVSEAMGAANAMKLLAKAGSPATKRKEINSTETEDANEESPLLDKTESQSTDSLYEIHERTEMSTMAQMFYSPLGLKLFYLCIIIYLFGDLAIYAVAVPKAMTNVVCQDHDSNSTLSEDEDHCFGSFNRVRAYYLFLGIFACLTCPFAFFNVSKTKYLQMFTTLMRYTAFIMMIVLALVGIGKGDGISVDSLHFLDVKELPGLFGVSIYAFMCHHSLPGLVTPITNKKSLNWLFGVDFMTVMSFYLLLCYTAVFRYGDDIQDIYTSNFKTGTNAFFSYFLGLFPVFTLSSNFPIIAVTLVNNLRILLSDYARTPFINRIVFPLIALVPPLIIAFCTRNVSLLVAVTGSYPGLGIQYVIPTLLVMCARKKLFEMTGEYRNIHSSPFKHKAFVYFMLIFSFVCICLITFNHIYFGK